MQEKQLFLTSNQLSRVVADLDLEVCFFTSFGKEVIKRLNLSPDAFFQVSLQLAMFRLRFNRKSFSDSPTISDLGLRLEMTAHTFLCSFRSSSDLLE